MATAKKYSTTKVQMFNEIVKFLEDSNHSNKEELIERIKHEIELCNKKSNSSANEAKKQLDETLMKAITETLTTEGQTVSEIQNKNPKLSLAEGVSNAKVTALLKKLVTSGTVVRSADKKKAYYAIA